MRSIKRITAVVLLLAAVCLYGCTGFVERFYPEETKDPDQSVFVPVDIEDGSIYFKDFDGNVITLSSAPEKVASLSEISTEIICGLGAGRYITALNESSLSVEGAPISAEVLPDYESDIDKLKELSPQIIFYDNTLSTLTAAMLRTAGFTLVRVLEKGDISTAEANIRFVSSLLYKDSNGEQMIAEMRAEYEKMSVLAELIGVKKRVYIEGTSAYYGCGGDSIVSELCAYAGAENVFADKSGTFTTNAAELKQKDPEAIIVLCNDTDNFQIETVTKRSGLEDVYAVRIKAVYAIDAKAAARPTQNITKALKSIGEALKVTK